MVQDLILAGLAEPMLEAVGALRRAFPFLRFTSGRRDLRGQAEAMAANILKSRNRGWIRETYRRAAELQTWVDTHPEVQDEDGLTEGLYGVLVAMGEDASTVSDHLVGLAVDLHPLERYVPDPLMAKPGVWVPTEEGQQVIAWIRAYPGTKYFTTREAGLRRWHWAVKPSVGQEV